MKKIVITLEMVRPISEEEKQDMMKAVMGFVETSTFVEDLADTMSFANRKLKAKFGIKKVNVRLEE